MEKRKKIAEEPWDEIGIFDCNNTQIVAIALPPLTTHPQLWPELLTSKPKCTIT